MKGEGTQIGEQAGGQTELVCEAGDGMRPSFWIGADAQEDGREIGVDGAVFVGAGDATGFVYQVEIFEFTDLQESGRMGVR